jgi:hypothetical protein
MFQQHDGVVAPSFMRLEPVHGVKHHVVGGGGVARKLGWAVEQHLGAMALRLGLISALSLETIRCEQSAIAAQPLPCSRPG